MSCSIPFLFLSSCSRSLFLTNQSAFEMLIQLPCKYFGDKLSPTINCSRVSVTVSVYKILNNSHKCFTTYKMVSNGIPPSSLFLPHSLSRQKAVPKGEEMQDETTHLCRRATRSAGVFESTARWRPGHWLSIRLQSGPCRTTRIRCHGTSPRMAPYLQMEINANVIESCDVHKSTLKYVFFVWQSERAPP